jgi:hypothetical protein
MVFRSLYYSPVQFVQLFVGGLEIVYLQQIGLQFPPVMSVVVTSQLSISWIKAIVVVTLLRRMSFHTDFCPNRSKSVEVRVAVHSQP